MFVRTFLPQQHEGDADAMSLAIDTEPVRHCPFVASIHHAGVNNSPFARWSAISSSVTIVPSRRIAEIPDVRIVGDTTAVAAMKK